MSIELLQRFMVHTPLGLAVASVLLIFGCVIAWLAWLSARALIISIHKRCCLILDDDFSSAYHKCQADMDDLKAEILRLVLTNDALRASETRLISSTYMLRAQLNALIKAVESDTGNEPSISVLHREVDLSKTILKSRHKGAANVSPIRSEAALNPSFIAKMYINPAHIGNFRIDEAFAAEMATKSDLEVVRIGGDQKSIFYCVNPEKLVSFFHNTALTVAQNQKVCETA